MTRIEQFIAEAQAKPGWKSPFPNLGKAMAEPAQNRATHLAGKNLQKRFIVTNRDMPGGDPDWIHIVPKGELFNHEAGITQVLDDKSMDSIMANIEEAKKRQGDRWPGIYGGEEHFIYNENKSSQAFAWFKHFQKRDDGIWASSDGLTDIGRTAIENRRFKYTSFCADPGDIQKLDGDRVRILKIDTIGFTNQANGKELLTPIKNSAAKGDDALTDIDAGDKITVTAACKRIQDGVATRMDRKSEDHDTAYSWMQENCPNLFAAAGISDIDPQYGGREPYVKGTVAHAKLSELSPKTVSLMKKNQQSSDALKTNNTDAVIYQQELDAQAALAKQKKAAAAISNRAESIFKGGGISRPGAYAQAQRESGLSPAQLTVQKIVNRAKEMQTESGMPYGDCFIRATAEIQAAE